MTNNDVLRRVRYIFNYNDSTMIDIFGLAGLKVTRAEVSSWLKKDDDEDYKALKDVQMSSFLNGLITKNRGKKDGPMPAPETSLNNNKIFMKLKIAFNLQAEEVLDVLLLANFRMSKHELSAFFRKTSHKHYRECKDQVLRNFLQGIQEKFSEKRDSKPSTPVSAPKNSVYGKKPADNASEAPSTAAKKKLYAKDLKTAPSKAKRTPPAQTEKPKPKKIFVKDMEKKSPYKKK